MKIISSSEKGQSLSFRELYSTDELPESVEIIRNAFQTVADDLNLTPGNAPTNPAFITMERLLEHQKKGARFYGLFDGEGQVGFVAVEKGPEGVYFLERLAVPPKERHRGLGRMLMDFVFAQVNQMGGTRVSIAIIDENTVLKKWYQDYGFVETGIKKFPHLPFTVCFMDKAVKQKTPC